MKPRKTTWFVFILNLSLSFCRKKANLLEKRTNFRLLRRHRDEPSDDVTKLTCMCAHGGHASIPILGKIQETLSKLQISRIEVRETNENIKFGFSTVCRSDRAQKDSSGSGQFTGAFSSFPGVHKSDGSAHVVKLSVGKKDAKRFSVSRFVFSKKSTSVFNVVASSNGIIYENIYILICKLPDSCNI